MLDVINGGTFLIVQLILETQIYCPIENLLFHTLQFLTLTEDFIIHLLNEARHGGHHVWIYLLCILGHLGYALSIVYLHAKILIEVVHHALVYVAKGHPTQSTRPCFPRRIFDAQHIQ